MVDDAERTRSQLDSIPATATVTAGGVLSLGELVGRFRVRRLVGEGGMGRVYLARDMVLGRSVALKLIRSANRDTEHFISEARITAELNHPHIVQLFDVGRHGAGPYLALEYLEGESLHDRMRRERVSVDECHRILRAIADALAHAHARGIRHCDLKPSNVMLPKDGRVRVVDFGLASRIDEIDVARGGTVDWMAPEQWQGEPVTERSDIWALAVVAFQLLTGEHPFGDAASREERRQHVVDPRVIPRPLLGDGASDQLIALITRSLVRPESQRPNATEWLIVLSAVLSGAAPSATIGSPYRGLAVFDERHAAFFFARDDDIDAFLERLREHALLPIVGPSGVGKSSFVLAGLLPRLRMRERWTVLSLRPGGDPFVAVARSVLSAEQPARPETKLGDRGGEVARLADDLRDHPALLAARLTTLAAATDSRVLLFVDQLEEIFTQGVPVPERERFFSMLALAADDPLEPLRVVYTVRDDYLGRVSSVQAVFVLGSLDEARLRRVITSPLDRLGYGFDAPSLVDKMLAEVRDSPAALPLLQFACRALWDARDVGRRLLLESAYRSQGGVAGALARHADIVLAGMVEEEQRVSRQMLTRLVVGTNARRIVERDQLLVDLPASAASVLDRLLSARLLVLHRTPDQSDASIEIAHESLLSSWTRLARWLADSGEERRLLTELDETVSFWERRGRRPEETWTAEEIKAVRRRAESLEIRLPDRVLEFFAAGQRRADLLRRRTRTRWIAAALVAVTVSSTALVLADVFRRQRNAAEQQAAALRLARGNLGQVEITLEPFDWIDGRPVSVPIAELPNLQLRLYTPAVDDLYRPGEPLPDELVTITRERIEAPGGTAFLRVEGRGRGADRCAASWIRLIALPGYADRDSLRRITITIPTCQASLAQTVQISEGEFIYGGPGSPPTQHPDYTQPEHRVQVGSFRIDETEVSNAQFAMFSKHAQFSGYGFPEYPSDAVLEHADEADRPVTGIDAFDAEAYCRFMGKRLPTDHEWTKAARGGLVIDGRPNLEPRRLYPWGGELQRACVNIDGEEDGYIWMAPVTAFGCGASPYGVLNMAGNAAEWIARHGQTDDERLRVVRGGAASAPIKLEHGTSVFRNFRGARMIDFGTGIRCVMDEDENEGTIWQKH